MQLVEASPEVHITDDQIRLVDDKTYILKSLDAQRESVPPQILTGQMTSALVHVSGNFHRRRRGSRQMCIDRMDASKLGLSDRCISVCLRDGNGIPFPSRPLPKQKKTLIQQPQSSEGGSRHARSLAPAAAEMPKRPSAPPKNGPSKRGDSGSGHEAATVMRTSAPAVKGKKTGDPMRNCRQSNHGGSCQQGNCSFGP